MIITRTPFRISFFGGGTDFPQYYRENGGAVLSTTIDKYCYLSTRKLPPFFDYKYRILYSKEENVKNIDEIRHPAVREVFKYMEVREGMVVHHDGDLPARSGLGSSSAFTVGMLHNLYARQGKIVSKRQLAIESMHVEQELLKENVGSQDQIAAAFGGFNRVVFGGDGEFRVEPITLGQERLDLLQDHLLLFYTGIQRIASDIEGEKVQNISKNLDDLKAIHSMVDRAMMFLPDGVPLEGFGQLLDEYWQRKKALSSRTTTAYIDDIYDRAVKAGASGGKILGAGQGGFIIFFAHAEKKQAVLDALSDLLHVPFRFDTNGSQVIYFGLNNESV